MGIPTLLDLFQRQVDLLLNFSHRHVLLYVSHFIGFPGDYGQFTVGQIDHIAGVFDNRGSIGGHQHLAIADPQQQGTAQPGGHHFLRVIQT